MGFYTNICMYIHTLDLERNINVIKNIYIIFIFYAQSTALINTQFHFKKCTFILAKFAFLNK